MSYLAFLFLLAGAAFLGLPILTSLIFSSVSTGYTACLEIGFIPALCILASTVLKGNFNSLHISSMVMPFIFLVSVTLFKNLKNCKKFHAITIQMSRNFPKYFKKSEDFFLYILTMCRNIPILYCISETTPLHRAGRAPIGANAVQDRGSNRRFFIQEEAC